MSGSRWIHYFADPLPDGFDAKSLLGGKGASLKEMTLAGLQVPPGFTLRTDCCRHFFDNDRRWPDGLEQEVRDNLARLEKDTGRSFGRGQRPLLVSVRSGAAVSMPGMMDTILNCGIGPQLAPEFGNQPWFWQRCLDFARMFARTVDGIDVDDLIRGADGSPASAEEQSGLHHGMSAVSAPQIRRETLYLFYEQYALRTGKEFPQDPWALLVACINAVFTSWSSERAITYRGRHDLRGLQGTAVNIQAMWPSEVSGICFTQDPTNLAGNRLVIEAAYGLGESVVSGDVDPDRFVVHRGNSNTIEKFIGHKASQVAAFGAARVCDPNEPSLNDAQLRDLYDLALRIERHFGHPVDIEWGWAEGRFALLQSRAIRGLDVAQAVEKVRLEEIARLKIQANGKRRLWVTHNLGETLRAPTPLTWNIMRRFMSGAGGFGRMYQQFGYRPSQRVKDDGFLDLIGGRVYADPDRLAELFWEDMPMTYDLEALAQDESVLDRAPTKFDPARTDALFLFRLPRNLWAMWRSSRMMKRARLSARTHFEETILPRFLAYVAERRGQDLGRLSEAELLTELESRCRQVLDEFGPESLKPGFFAGMAFGALEQRLVQMMGVNEGTALAGTLTLALEGDITIEQDEMLYRIAQGQSDLEKFLAKFGHRCIGEMELSTPRWRENPAYLEQTITRFKANPAHDPALSHQKNLERWRAAHAELPGLLKKWGGLSFREEIEYNLADARNLLPYRESGKFYLMMGYELIRLVLQELGRRWDLGNDLYFLKVEELGRFVRERASLQDEIARRKIQWQAQQRLDMPEIIDSKELDGLGLPRQVASASEYPATSLAPGVAVGTARIVDNPQEVGDLGNDYVLVCASTDPGWTPLFMHARGLIVERGGVLSHGAIVARDFGIPAVACPSATKLLKDGDSVRVDGNQGKVVILERN
jgi:pyruvate,water dikinase